MAEIKLAEKTMDDAVMRAGVATKALEDKKRVVSMLTDKLKKVKDKAAGYDELKINSDQKTK